MRYEIWTLRNPKKYSLTKVDLTDDRTYEPPDGFKEVRRTSFPSATVIELEPIS